MGASFAGDAFYRPSGATQTLTVYQLTQFDIWGGHPPIPAGHQPANVAVGQDYAFWGAHWAKQVQGDGTWTAKRPATPAVRPQV